MQQAPRDESVTPPRATSWRSGVGRRLALNVVLFSLLVAVCLSALQALAERRAELQLLETRVTQIMDSSGNALALAVWNLDRDQVQLLLQGIASLPDVMRVELEQGEAGWFGDGRPLVIGAPRNDTALHWDRAIEYERRGRLQTLARLRISFDLAAVEQRLFDRALRSMGAQVALSLLIAAFLLWVVNQMVTRHLVRLAEVAGSYDVRRAPVSFDIGRTRRGPKDELDRVIGALEAMRLNLEVAYQALERVNQALVKDMAARKEAERAAAHMARHDALTGLPNRRLLIERLQVALDVAESTRQQGALLFIDLDNFKQLNDARGHSIGDAVLVELAHRLSAMLPAGAVAARMGGDEFVLMLTGLDEQPGLSALRATAEAERVKARISEPVAVGGELFRLGASIGIALFPSDGGDIESLIRHADSAMYQAKSEGRNQVKLFQPSLVSRVEERHAMESDLREALELGQFQLHFQPIVDAEGRLVGAESLLRWHHPRRGRVPPGEFIPLSEESGLILEVGDWVLGEALSHMVRWRHRGLMREGQYLSVNISPRQFRQRDFVELLIQRVEAAGVSPSQLALEITEGSVIGDSDDTLLNLQRLRTAGFRLLIDDFGVGYSSLSYLKRLPVHGIKIDQSFVRDIGSDPSDAALVQSLITIGTHFKLGVIAEGVETEQHSSLLRDMGCGYFQGYHFDRPQPGEAFEARWLLQRSSHEV